MAGVLLSPPLRSLAPPRVQLLRVEDVPALRLPGLRSSDVMRDALAHSPGRSVWIPETLEYALIGLWRNRSEIASVEELVAVRNVEPLLRAAREQSIERGDELLLAIELETNRGMSRYERAGMELLEEVITYDMDILPPKRAVPRGIGPIPISPGDRRAIDQVTDLDREAFPWLWQNSREEFDVYLATPGVQVSFVAWHGDPVGYFGTTLFSGWGHLDRIAVAPQQQGRGFGRAALTLAIEGLQQQGARRIGLSTQLTNKRSQRLYERFGFQRTHELDYQLYGYLRRFSHNAAMKSG
jgi:ribosomal protein S18 acetylase RimI-like enzyme